MSIEEFFRNLESKEESIRNVVGQVLSNRRVISFLVNGLFAYDMRVRYECAGLLNLIAESSPQLLYPHFNSLRDALDSLDPVVRSDVFKMIKGIACVDSQRKIEALQEDYGTALAFQPG